jgi:hypothetical protein
MKLVWDWHEIGSCYGSHYEILGREKDFINLDIHETKVLYHMVWAFGFGCSYACTTNFYCW